MINISEQLSAARKSQIEAQLNFFSSYASKAVASTEKLVALNVNLARETVERSSTTLCQALTARAPSDLFALTAGTPDAFSSWMAYGRELLAIAAGGAGSIQPATPTAAPAATQARNEQPREERPALTRVPAPQPVAVQSEPSGAPVAEPEAVEVNHFRAEASPEVTAKPLARALASVGGAEDSSTPVAASFPSAEQVEVQVTSVKPVDATPPPAPAAGTPEVAQQETQTGKGRKKK